MIKYFAMIKRKDGLTQSEFLHHWKERHGPLAAKVIPGFKKYIQCHPIKVTGIEFSVDGIAEIWWENLESLQNYFLWRQSDEAIVLKKDEEEFMDTSQTVRFIAEEHVIAEREI